MTLQLESLKSNKGARRRKLRKGRGIAAGQGASCGFGMRGQKSRSGRPTRPGFEGGQMPLYRRVPMRGFNNSNFQKSYEIVNLSKISKIKDKNIDSEVLFKNGLISSIFAAVKILGNGDIDKAYNITASSFSEAAVKKIEKAGGKVVVE